MKIKILGVQLLLVMAILLPGGIQAQTKPAQDINSLFVKANQDYQNNRFQEAAKAYTTILQEKKNGYLYFNLGNCYLKMNEIGKAILNYRRAEKFIPRFADLKMNLKYARQETRDKIEDKSYSQFLRTVFFWQHRLSKQELLIGFLILNFVFFVLASIKMYTQIDTIKWLLFITGVFYLLSTGSVAAKFYQENSQKAGVVIEDKIEVRSGSNLNNVVLFKLHAGTEARIEEVKQDWLKIVLPDGKIGWVQKNGLGII